MKKVIIGSIVLAFVVIFAGCRGKQIPLNTKFKGLYIGMPIEEAHKLCTIQLKGVGFGIKISQIKQGCLSIYDIGATDGKYFGFDALGMHGASGAVTADANGKVNGFLLATVIVNHLWKNDSIDTAGFAKLLAKSCGLKEIPLSADKSQRLYESTSGLRIVIEAPLRTLIVSKKKSK